MPVSPDAQEPGHHEAKNNPEYPLLSLFLDADAPIWEIEPRDHLRYSSDWLNRFRVEVDMQEERVKSDFQAHIQYRRDFPIKKPILAETTNMFSQGLFEYLSLRKIDTVLVVVLLLGYELPEHVREKYLPDIFRTLHNHANLVDSEEAHRGILRVLQIGRNLWHEFHGTPAVDDAFNDAMVPLDENLRVIVPDPFQQAEYDMRQIVPKGIVYSAGDVPQPPDEDDPPTAFAEFIKMLDLSGLEE